MSNVQCIVHPTHVSIHYLLIYYVFFYCVFVCSVLQCVAVYRSVLQCIITGDSQMKIVKSLRATKSTV